MMDVEASIVVATRNRARYLDDCLGSLSALRADRSAEILVIDNASSDDTPRVIETWQRRNAAIRTFQETQVGLSAAKNAGARLAEGRVLLFTDDDVLVEPGWLGAYLDFFSRADRDNILAGGPIIPILNDLGRWPAWFDEAGLPEAGMLDHGVERALGTSEYVWGANMAMTAALFHRIGPWNECLGRRADERGTFEDTEYQDRVRASGGAVWFCPDAGLRHRIEPERIRPRQLMRTAFSLGRHRFWRDQPQANSAGPTPSAGTLPHELRALAASFVRWVGWAVVFRTNPTQATFRRARSGAFSSGWRFERAREQTDSLRLRSLLNRVVGFLHRLALRVTANV
jgi:GT2 family glycosyltransferase